jgi:hypothetical protein
LFRSSETLEAWPAPPRARVVAVTSLLLWILATTAGRLMGYLGPVSGLD